MVSSLAYPNLLGTKMLGCCCCYYCNHIQWVIILKLNEKVQEPYIFNNCSLFLDPPKDTIHLNSTVYINYSALYIL
jgi:hypothetical protein